MVLACLQNQDVAPVGAQTSSKQTTQIDETFLSRQVSTLAVPKRWYLRPFVLATVAGITIGIRGQKRSPSLRDNRYPYNYSQPRAFGSRLLQDFRSFRNGESSGCVGHAST